MAKASEQQPTEASRIAALEEWSSSTAEFMASVNERLGALEARVEEVVTAGRNLEQRVGDMDLVQSSHKNAIDEAHAKLADVGHVSRATAENGSVSDDVFARIKRLEAHAGLKDARTADEAGS